MTNAEIIAESLERCAEAAGDISDPVYARFFESDAVAHGLMAHSDQYMRGRMLEQTIELLLTEQPAEPGGYLEWEVDNHLSAYGVQVDMYASFLRSVRETVATCLGAEWNDTYAAAWDEHTDSILTAIGNAPAAAAS